MVIPASMEKLNAADSALSQSARQDAIGSERSRLARIVAVVLEGVFRFIGQVCHFGDRGLHPECHFVLSDSVLYYGIREIGFG